MNIAKKLLLGAALGVLCAGGAMAQETTLKIGFVNLQALTVESPQGREANEKIQDLFSERQRDINLKQTNLTELRENFDRDRETMSTEQVRQAERDILTLNREIQQEAQAFEQDLQIERNNIDRDLSQIFVSHARQVAEDNDYDLVLTEQVVVYFSDAVNITPQVLGALQETYSSEQQD